MDIERGVDGLVISFSALLVPGCFLLFVLLVCMWIIPVGLECKEGFPTGDFTLQTYHRQWIAEQDISRRIVRELIAEILHIAIDSLVDLFDFHGAFIDLVFFTLLGFSKSVVAFPLIFSLLSCCLGFDHGQCIQITAWGSFARDVPRRNLRRAFFVSGEKV